MSSPDARPRQGLAGVLWPAFIVALLAIPVVAAAILVRAAGRDPSFAVEEDYYAKSLAWDEEMRQRALNERLGWGFDLQASAAANERLLVRVRLHDAEGRPLSAERVKLEAFPVARASRLAKAALRPDEDGSWATSLPFAHGGLWELRLSARAGGEDFTEVLRRDMGVR